jgi:hypothetical protein
MSEEKRIWNLRLNLDDFNSEYLKARNDSDRLSFFLGFHLGCMGGTISESDPKQFEAGFVIGIGMFRKAEELSKINSKGANASVDVRRRKYGTAQPSPSVRSSVRSEDDQAFAEQTPEPTLDELTAYAKEIGFKDPQKWMDHYVSNGWKVGKVKMVDWKACVRNWNRSPSMSITPAKPRPEWVVAKIEQLKREKRRFEASGRTNSAADIQREIDQLEKGNP